MSCRHESSTGDEGPVVELGGRHVVRWRCGGCGVVHYSDAALSALRDELRSVRTRLAEQDELIHMLRNGDVWAHVSDKQIERVAGLFGILGMRGSAGSVTDTGTPDSEQQPQLERDRQLPTAPAGDLDVADSDNKRTTP